jgi:membrane-associated phospholipid phosphatase
VGKWLFTCAATVVVVIFCLAYVDRPSAEFFEAHVRHTGTWIWVRRLLAPFDAAVLAALLFLLGCGAWVISGRSLSSWTNVPRFCSWAAMWAVAADIIFKHVFGRAWVDPTYIQNHLYGFHFFHGGPHWESFPSGTAAISLAIVSVLWSEAPRLRTIGLVIVVLLCVGVVINNFHWVSDVVAGAFLGVLIGRMTIHMAQKQVDSRALERGSRVIGVTNVPELPK